MDHYIGTLLDQRYEILENIGSGGMAFVYKARCNRLNRLVAVKILKQELLQDEDFRRRFHAESQAVAMMSHPNIVSVYDVSHSEHLDYIVMELIEGISLKQYMEQKKVLNWREALHFATQIAKALEHAHSRGIVHRDIKPHNIMILKDGSVKVADFGIAQMATAQNTLTREALGSVHYISPEQAKGAHVDAGSDLYSLGVVLYEMLTGRPPFDGDTPVSVAIQHINAKAPLPHTINATIPIGLEQITMHAMTADRDTRYTQASEMIHDLEEFRKNPNALFGFDDVHTQFTSEQVGQELPPMSEPPKPLRFRIHPKQPQRAEDDETDTRGGRIAVLAGIVCIVLAFLGIAYFLYSYFVSDIFSRTEEDVVPSFIGAYYEDIDPSQYPNFKISIAQWTASETYDFGYVIDQTPSAERNAKVGTEILLTVSSGAQGDIMPDLVNMTLQNALTCLNTMRISVTAAPKYEVSDVYTDGYVIRTEPQRDEPLIDGQTVVIYVSQGSSDELVQVPTLVGRTINEARALIDAAGLSTGSALIVESEQPEGIVIFQGIAAQEMVKKGTVVNLQISRGPEVSHKPKITSISTDAEVMQSEELILQVQAQADGSAELQYRWYVSADGDRENGTLVSEETTCSADTSQPGEYSYFCEITNLSAGNNAVTYSDPIRVTVLSGDLYTEIILHVRMPSKDGVYTVSVNVGDEERVAPFELDMSELPSREIEIPVLGSGVQTVSVYVDGELFDTQLIEFDSEG